MNIIELAKEAGWTESTWDGFLTKFAALVRAEYEKPLKLAEEALSTAVMVDQFQGGEWEDYAYKALAAIREALAEPVNREGMVYYKNNDCKAKDANSPDCICWTKAEPVKQEPKCSDHPDAPHGFCRDASHTMDRYVCECEFWEPPKMIEVYPTKFEAFDSIDEEFFTIRASEDGSCAYIEFQAPVCALAWPEISDAIYTALVAMKLDSDQK